MTIHLW